MTGITTREEAKAAGPISRTAIWSAKHPWLALGVWLVLVVATFSISFTVQTKYATSTERITGESQQAARMVQASGKDEPAIEVVLVTKADGEAFAETDPADLETAGTLKTAIEQTEHVRSVAGPIPSDDRTALLYRASIDGDPETASQRLDDLRRTTADLGRDHPDLRIEQTGAGSMQADFQAWLGADLDKAAAISLPLTLVVLLIAFGALVAAGLPLVVGAGAVLSAMGLWAAASQLVPDQGTVAHVILLIGMAVGVDYALFYLRRFREEKHAGSGPIEATAIAARTAGHSVIVSGTAVALAMAGLLLMQEAIFTGVAVGAILVVLIAMVSAVTAMPALMRLLHRWVDRPRVPFAWRLTNGGKEPKALQAVLRPVIRRPLVALLAAGLILGAMAIPALGMKLKATTIEDFPRSLQSMQTYDRVTEAYPSNVSTARVVVETPSDDRQDLLAAAQRINDRTTAQPEFFGNAAEPWVSADGRYLVMDVAIAHRPNADQARDAVKELRSTILPESLTGVDSPTHAVGGDVAANLDDSTNLTREMPWVVGIVIAMTFVFMLAVYRSLAIAFVTILLNIVSTLASFGLLTLIFQGTWAERLLGFQSNGHVVSWIPLMLFVVLSGLSLDYHVLVVNRIRENCRLGISTQRAVLEGVTKTAGVVTSAAAVMIAVFSVFATLTFVEMKQIGIGLALATLLDVTVIRLVALPALLVAFRKVLWWPGRLPEAAGSDDLEAELAALDSSEDDARETEDGQKEKESVLTA
ncbi:MMPL family transporter [Granulicoccus sp. GXG6511]|uniref:MMPL family transporter n=1 Tax=Granulicoccus sp. GXG6511 TaxID=3381351 RepID=UPI003D7D49EC